jgi:hypothetical protein
MLESAIPEHLVQERTRPVSTPANYEPPFPAYSARFPRETKDIVMAVIGAQYPSAAENDGKAIPKLLEFIEKAPEAVRPSFHEQASVTDHRGAYNITVLAYWPTKAAYTEWTSASGFQQWWDGLKPEEEKHGWSLEVFFPSVDRFETVFSDNTVPEGAAHMRQTVSGPLREHVYWGSMRDRLAVSQADDLVGETASMHGGRSNAETHKRVRVPGKQNLAIIRSGQDWSNTYPEERKLYLETMHPVLIKGMDFLRDEGDKVGCYSCRFMSIVDPATQKADKDRTFGLAFFDDLSSLEKWSKEHKTHLDIFGGFLQYAKQLENNVSLRLFHEVLVLKPDQQLFEYIGCHDGTGMLASVDAV